MENFATLSKQLGLTRELTIKATVAALNAYFDVVEEETPRILKSLEEAFEEEAFEENE